MSGRGATGHEQAGFTLVEVLVTALIIAFGLLSLAGLQAKMAATQMEAYQRAHALLLVEDMVARINSQRSKAKEGSYAALGTMTTVGTADARVSTDACAQTSIPERDLCEWSRALKGAGTMDDEGRFLGAMIGARGCIERVPPDPNRPAILEPPWAFQVSVAWQGLTETAAPSWPCGSTADYGGAGLRRVLAMEVILADLN